MKVETMLSNLGRSIDKAIATIQAEAPRVMHDARVNLSAVLVRAAEKVHPK